MNVVLLRQVKEAILAEPRKFDMLEWAKGVDEGDLPIEGMPPCGTIACIAGWAVLMRDYDGLYDKYLADGAPAIHVRAQEVLGLDYNQKENLFHIGYWPEKFSNAYFETEMAYADGAIDLPTMRERCAQIAADRIEHFIATGGAE